MTQTSPPFQQLSRQQRQPLLAPTVTPLPIPRPAVGSEFNSVHGPMVCAGIVNGYYLVCRKDMPGDRPRALSLGEWHMEARSAQDLLARRARPKLDAVLEQSEGMIVEYMGPHTLPIGEKFDRVMHGDSLKFLGVDERGLLSMEALDSGKQISLDKSMADRFRVNWPEESQQPDIAPQP